MSSSDGQRFPVRGKSLTSRDMNIHGGRVLLPADPVRYLLARQVLTDSTRDLLPILQSQL